ncbi:hypothetical protein [Lutibacter maritimus]|uniref:Uncharacterized protein n=1 Tax=Lutibacter maritimus TaxID=593133 RepID=A0A1I6NRH9_9FLAO|nr:hypothetical protein [Lutibacter maritimus]SFS30602.1 hypothetical protein SAMN04488006_0458 [Lutibacter maritimus]
MPFENNIFINCPFDKAYQPIIKAIVFGVVYLGYNPLLSETINGANARVGGIQDLINESKFSIHDLSRMESSKKGELARFNMPFELGLDMGCKRFGSPFHNEKYFLIFDKEKYRYQKSISDIAGNDICIHNNEPEKALRQIRNWIRKVNGQHIDSANKIWRLFNEFNGDFFEIARADELNEEDIKEMPWDEHCFYIREWLNGRNNFE